MSILKPKESKKKQQEFRNDMKFLTEMKQMKKKWWREKAISRQNHINCEYKDKRNFHWIFALFEQWIIKNQDRQTDWNEFECEFFFWRNFSFHPSFLFSKKIHFSYYLIINVSPEKNRQSNRSIYILIILFWWWWWSFHSPKKKKNK